MKFGTKVIHAGIRPDPSTGAIMTPIYQTSTYVQKAPGEHLGFEYSRTQNPTRKVLEENMAVLENGKYGISFASGMAAIDAIVRLLKPGDEVISTSDLYGGTYRIFTKIYAAYGIKFHFVDMSDPVSIVDYFSHRTKLIWIETPTNPMMNIVDIKSICKKAVDHQILVAVDNTFATPCLQRPLDLGADIVVHSATKYLGGHSDLILGLVVVKDPHIAEKLYFIQNACGAVPGPQDVFLVLRGIKTLEVRMERHCSNAGKIVNFLSHHEKTDRVFWPGLADHRNHEVAAIQMKDFGGMASFTMKGDRMEDAVQFMKHVKVFALAESLGGVESLCGHPATMTHASIPADERAKVGLKDSLIRLSIGIEDAEDLIEDLDQALNQV
ncbi:MAG: PLP-dependent transferase [Cyclobacteriaceae bacterium]|nr:PLP-dependent transferase [Cyclobacteriaceae bacterium]